MKHIIENREVHIDWEVGETIDNHGSGCKDVQLTGVDVLGNCYYADGNTQDGELVEVYEIECVLQKISLYVPVTMV